MSAAEPTRILILGGGFAGMYAAMQFEKTLARDPDVEVTMVNRENFFLFTPMLHEVAASDLDLTTIVNPARKMLKRVNFFAGEVEGIDLPSKQVRVSHGFEGHEHTLRYDHLVVGLGSITNFYNLPGLEQRALTMKSLGDAITLRNHLIAQLEEADSECCRFKHPLLTFVVAGGGFAGVETIAGVNDFVRESLHAYPHLTESMLRVVLVHPGPVILPELGEKLGAYAQKKLTERKVEILVNTRVEGVSEEAIELSNGTTLEANTLVWTAGTSPNPLMESIPCEKERGRLKVNRFMEVPDWPGVWALGDCAAVPDPKTGKTCPPTAQHALRQGKVLAGNIQAEIRGGRKKPFEFSTVGQLAAIGKRTGVANILGVNFSGFFAWWLWRTIYLSKLPRFEKKVRVALDWTLDILFSKDLVQFLTVRAPSVSRSEEDPPVRAVSEVVARRG
ncbi:MAG: NAD(P)/FAD-dependent oxidoreductase [Acidobacteriia bacterium]|nr:NAD(P)/FAD-dependent oxidoreductase [Terriglobia bacterium]